MKLVRYGNTGAEKPGVMDASGTIRDISSLVDDLSPRCLGALDVVEKIRSVDLATLPTVDAGTRLGPCVCQPGKILCVGFNSRLHAEQMGFKADDSGDMVAFLKPASALCGARDPILYSRYTRKLDWEAELGVVIGRKGKYIPRELALEYVIGYTCVNDLSDRYWQFETMDKQYTKGKGFDSFAPIGPCIATKDEVPDPSCLSVKLWVNGTLRQDFTTGDYIYGVAEVVSYLSRFFTLHPGDVIAMGSAPGNARSWGEDAFLRPGDRVVLDIGGVGRQEQAVEAE